MCYYGSFASWFCGMVFLWSVLALFLAILTCFLPLCVLIDFSLTAKVATLIFIPGRGSAISSAKQGKSGSIYNLVKNK